MPLVGLLGDKVVIIVTARSLGEPPGVSGYQSGSRSGKEKQLGHNSRATRLTPGGKLATLAWGRLSRNTLGLPDVKLVN